MQKMPNKGAFLALAGTEAGGTKARPLCGLAVVFAEGRNDKLKIRRDADFEPKTALSAPTPRRRVTAAAGFPLQSLARFVFGSTLCNGGTLGGNTQIAFQP